MRRVSIFLAILNVVIGVLCSNAYSNDSVFTVTTALVIVDMQPEFISKVGSPRSKNNQDKISKLIQVQRKLIQEAHRKGSAVIVLEYQRPGRLLTDSERTLPKIVKEVLDGPRKAFFTKSSNGAFSHLNLYKNELVNYLKREKIDHLVFTGANGGACVFETIQGTPRRFRVTAPQDAIADFNFHSFQYPYELPIHARGKKTSKKLNIPKTVLDEGDDSLSCLKTVRNLF